MSLRDEYNQALRALKDWHCDSVKAQSFDGPSISQTKPGATELRAQDYPHERYWENEWWRAKNEAGRRDVVDGMWKELNDIKVSPSKKYLHWEGTLEKKRAIATEDGQASHVARLYGVSESTVYRYRKKYSGA